MDTIASWFANNWTHLLTALGGIAGLIVGVILLLALGYAAMQMLNRIGRARLDRAKLAAEEIRVRGTATDEADQLRRELRTVQKTAADAAVLIEQQKKLLTAQEENLDSRAKEISRISAEAKAAIAKATSEAKASIETARQETAAARQERDQVAAELAAERTAHAATHQDLDATAQERDQLSQACGMLERQCKGLESNVGMLQTTVTDLNAKRDLLTAEVRHLSERLGQETALREAIAKGQS